MFKVVNLSTVSIRFFVRFKLFRSSERLCQLKKAEMNIDFNTQFGSKMARKGRELAPFFSARHCHRTFYFLFCATVMCATMMCATFFSSRQWQSGAKSGESAHYCARNRNRQNPRVKVYVFLWIQSYVSCLFSTTFDPHLSFPPNHYSWGKFEIFFMKRFSN